MQYVLWAKNGCKSGECSALHAPTCFPAMGHRGGTAASGEGSALGAFRLLQEGSPTSRASPGGATVSRASLTPGLGKRAGMRGS